jgi:hypothetical protein
MLNNTLKNNNFHGMVLKDKDPKNQGRYKVHIPTLMYMIEESKGIWVKNQIHKWRYTSSNDYFYGEYKPIQPGSLVIIQFYENDINAGYIDRIISDQKIKSMPNLAVNKEPKSINERDDIYIIYKTPKNNNLFAILEDTTDSETGLDEKLIPNSIHQYYNEQRTTIIINEDGHHLFTKDNKGLTVEKDDNKWIKGNDRTYIEKDKFIKINGIEKKYIKKGSVKISEGKNVSLSSGSQISKSEGVVSFDAPMIYLNSNPPESIISEEELNILKAPVNKGEDEIEVQNKITQKTKPIDEDTPDLKLKD